MKQIIFLSLILLTITQSQVIYELDFNNTELLNQMFEEFQETYDKEYEDYSIKMESYLNFIENLKIVSELNLNKTSNTMEYSINQYSDLSDQQFESQILMPARKATEFPNTSDNEQYIPIKEKAPEYWNWAEHGAVTPVQNQGTAGSCWAFSTTGNVEGQWFLAGNEIEVLSVEQLVECDSSTNAPDADCGVFGGWPYLGFTYIINVGGVTSNQQYRYCVGVPKKEEPCYPCVAPGYDSKLCGPGLYPPQCNQQKWHCRSNEVSFVAHLSSWKNLSTDEEVLVQQLYDNGPISVALNASHLGKYKSGIYSPKNCNPDKLNHAVLLVGYGHDDEEDMDYWIVKNSWGTQWGEDGYFRIQRGVGMCGINKQPATGIVGDEYKKQKVQEIDL